MTDSLTRGGSDEAFGGAKAPGEARALVSVVVIFLDAERFLRPALESILAQTYGNWELLLVDDGSEDGSSQIARECADADPDRVQYLQHEGARNLGMSASRNAGIAASSGEFVAFLDADDVWLPDKLEHQVRLLESHPDVGMVYGPTEYWFSWTGDPVDRERDFLSKLAVDFDRPIEPPELLVRALATHGGMLPGICSLVVRRSALERAGTFDPEFKGSYEDQVFFTKMFRHTKILVTDRCLDRYRQHDDSCCAVAQRSGEYHPDKPHPARRRYLEWLDGYLEEHPLDARDPWRERLRLALAKEWMPYRRPLAHGLQTVTERVKRQPKRAASLVKRRMPDWMRTRLRRYFREWRFVPPVGWVRFGSLRRLAPISRDYGYDRGLPIDRYYIEAFLERHAHDIRGRVLEVGDDAYTRRFGGDAVTSCDILHMPPGTETSTVVADLANAPHIPDNTYDCIVLTQTLQYIFDLRSAIATLHRVLVPGGVVLVTAPGITQIVECPWRENWFWGFTEASARKLFLERFPMESIRVDTPGNVVTATAFLQGLSADELRARELAHDDRDYQLMVTVRAEKQTGEAMHQIERVD